MTTLHIQPADDASQGGAGTSTDPLRIHGPEHFDRLLAQTATKLTGLKELVLHYGEYLTRGAWSTPYYALGRPFHLRGFSVPKKPTIKLAPDAIFEANGVKRPDALVLRLGTPFRNNHTPDKWVVENIIFDGNEQAFGPDNLVLSPVSIWGHGVTIRNCVAKNLRGRRPAGANDENNHFESFGFTIHGHQNGDHGVDGGNLIENCSVFDNGDRNPYFSGIYPGVAYYGRPVAPSVVRGCIVSGTGKRASQGTALSLQENTHYIGCLVSHMRYGLYNDVRPVNWCLVQDCTFAYIAYCGLALRASMKFEASVPHKRNVMVRDCEFTFTPEEGKEWVGLWLDDAQKTGAHFENITLENCTFREQPRPEILGTASTRAFVAYSVDAKNASGIRITGSLPPRWRGHLGVQMAGIDPVTVEEEEEEETTKVKM